MTHNLTDHIENACARLAELGPQFVMLKNMWENLEITDECRKNLFVSLKEILDTFDHIKHILITQTSNFQNAHAKIEALENNEMYKWAKEVLQTEEAKPYHN